MWPHDKIYRVYRQELENHIMLYSGGEQHAKGVALIVTKDVGKSVLGCWTVSERVMIVKFKCKPVNINIIQVYAPTSDATMRSPPANHQRFLLSLPTSMLKLANTVNQELQVYMDLATETKKAKLLLSGVEHIP